MLKSINVLFFTLISLTAGVAFCDMEVQYCQSLDQKNRVIVAYGFDGKFANLKMNQKLNGQMKILTLKGHPIGLTVPLTGTYQGTTPRGTPMYDLTNSSPEFAGYGVGLNNESSVTAGTVTVSIEDCEQLPSFSY